jgi:hypothetical protein
MNEGYMKRLAALAAARVRTVAVALAEAAEAEMPPGLSVERREDGIAIAGRGLLQRMAFEPGLRGFIDQVRR